MATQGSRLDRLYGYLEREGATFLKATLGVVFVWFGGLKLAGRSPVEELVATTMPWFDAAWFVPVLGVVEVAIGIGLIFELLLPVVLALFAAQMLGTFSILVFHPTIAFQGYNPLLLTVEGEFVVKNLVLLAAGLAIAGSLHRSGSREPKANERA